MKRFIPVLTACVLIMLCLSSCGNLIVPETSSLAFTIDDALLANLDEGNSASRAVQEETALLTVKVSLLTADSKNLVQPVTVNGTKDELLNKKITFEKVPLKTAFTTNVILSVNAKPVLEGKSGTITLTGTNVRKETVTLTRILDAGGDSFEDDTKLSTMIAVPFQVTQFLGKDEVSDFGNGYLGSIQEVKFSSKKICFDDNGVLWGISDNYLLTQNPEPGQDPYKIMIENDNTGNYTENFSSISWDRQSKNLYLTSSAGIEGTYLWKIPAETLPADLENPLRGDSLNDLSKTLIGTLPDTNGEYLLQSMIANNDTVYLVYLYQNQYSSIKMGITSGDVSSGTFQIKKNATIRLSDVFGEDTINEKVSVPDMTYQAGKLYMLLSYKPDDGANQGALIRINPDTLSFTADDVLGVPTVSTADANVKASHSSWGGDLLDAYLNPIILPSSLTSTEKSTSALYSPGTFAAVRPNKLIFTDNGWCSSGDTLTFENSLVTVDLKTFSVESKLSLAFDTVDRNDFTKPDYQTEFDYGQKCYYKEDDDSYKAIVSNSSVVKFIPVTPSDPTPAEPLNTMVMAPYEGEFIIGKDISFFWNTDYSVTSERPDSFFTNVASLSKMKSDSVRFDRNGRPWGTSNDYLYVYDSTAGTQTKSFKISDASVHFYGFSWDLSKNQAFLG